jgi:hypothetical protein
MKNFILLLLLSPIFMLGQSSIHHHNSTEKISDTATYLPNIGYYVSVGVSLSNGPSVKNSAFPSIEFGVSHKNLMGGLSVGKGSFNKQTTTDYFYEFKGYTSIPLGAVKAYMIFGAGSYFNSKYAFIEYGSGVTYSIKKTDISLQASNWDKVDYLSLSFAYNL